MRQLVWHHALVLGIAILIFFTNLGGARLWDQDEPRNAGCALEMQQRGDWIVPIFNDQLRDAKPVLLYWLILGSYSLFGVSEFAARFASAFLAVGTVMATYQIGHRLFNATTALWAAIILSTSMMFGIAGRAATPDSTLIFCGTVSIMIYVLATFKPRRRSADDVSGPELRHPQQYFPRQFRFVAPMYGMMGLGVLAKGPVGFVLPTAVVGMFLLLVRLRETTQIVSTAEPTKSNPKRTSQVALILFLAAAIGVASALRGWMGLGALVLVLAIGALLSGNARWLYILRPFAPRHFGSTCWSMRPVLAVLIVTAVALPWYALVGLRTEGDFLRGFFIHEHFGRATTAMEKHDGPPIYYLVAILVGFFPWSVFAVPMLIGVVQRIRRRDPWQLGLVFLACWVGVYVGLFTLASTKLPSYITPCYPALALMTGCFIFHWTGETSVASPYWPTVSFASLAAVGVGMIVAIPFFAIQYLPGHEWLAAIGLIPVVAAVASLMSMRLADFRIAACTMAAGAILLSTAIFGAVTEQVDRHRYHDRLLAAISTHSDAPQIGHLGPLEPSWVFYGQHPIRNLLLDSPSPPSTIGRTKDWQQLPPLDVVTFFSTHSAPFVITTDEHLDHISAQLPDDVGVLARVPYFLKPTKLVLLGKIVGERTAQRTDGRLRSDRSFPPF